MKLTAVHAPTVSLTATVGRFVGSGTNAGQPIGLLLALTYA